MTEPCDLLVAAPQRTRFRLLGWAIFVSTLIDAGHLAGATDARDCEAMKRSAAPYELQMRQGDGSTYPIQVYRAKNLTRMQYTKIPGNLAISRFQANFHLEYEDLSGANVRFTYSVPTDRYIWQQAGRVVTYNTIIDGAPSASPGFTQVYQMLADTIIPVGGCSFAVKHFRLKQESSAKKSDEEIWFSPELGTNLRSVEVTTFANGKTTKRELEAAAIAPVSAPLR